MKPIKVFIAATLLVASVLPVAAQTRTVRRTKPASRVRKHKPAPPAATSRVVTLPSGLSYIITRQGEGRQPLPGEKVIVNYTGVMPNGIKFDSSLDRGQPYAFPLGRQSVIKGWDEGFAKLRVGTQATLIIPPALAYGENGYGPIPPNTTLIFIVELLGIEDTPPSP